MEDLIPQAPIPSGAPPAGISLTHVFDIHYGLRTPVDFGATPHGQRIFFTTSGGVFQGPGINGTVLPEGNDWTLTGGDGVTHIDVRIVLKTDDDAMIHASWVGKVRIDPEVRLFVAEPESRALIPSESVYFRTTPVFETGAQKYAWLTQHAFVASARFTREGLCYRVMRVD